MTILQLRVIVRDFNEGITIIVREFKGTERIRKRKDSESVGQRKEFFIHSVVAITETLKDFPDYKFSRV